jgi:hypothetical protein
VRTIRANDPVTIQVLGLIEAAGLRETCHLDLLLFFSRHPRVVLSSEQLAIYVGHDAGNVARALEMMLGASLLTQVQNAGGPGMMYVFEAHHLDAWLEPLRGLCNTPDGRRALRTLLKERRAQMTSMNGHGNGNGSAGHG